MKEPEPLRNGKLIGVSFSLAGLLLAKVWEDVDQVTTAMAAYRLGPGAPRTFEAVALVGVVMFTGVFAGLIRALQKVKDGTAAGVAMRTIGAASALAIGSILLLVTEEVSVHVLANGWLSGHEGFSAAFLWASRLVRWVLIPGSLAAGVVWFPERTWATAQLIATVMIPFAAWRTGDAFYHPVRPRSPVVASQAPPPEKSRGNLPWMVWLVFDEMDQAAGFEDPRNAGLMPGLTAFRESAFYATRAYEPSRPTSKSIPAYLTGRLAVEERWGPEGLQLRFLGSEEYVSWWRRRTIFDEATEAGHTVAVLGHFHPYCEIFGELTSACAVFPACASADLKAWVATPEGRSFWRTAQLELVRLLPLPPTETRYDGRRFRYSDWVLYNHGIQAQSRCLAEVTLTVLRWLRESVATFYFLHLPVTPLRCVLR